MNSKMNIRLLIPIKSLDKVKSRLSEEIEDKFRIGLSLAMLDHVIQTGIRASEFEDVLDSTVIRKDIVGEMAKLGKLTDMSAEAQGRFASLW